MEYDIEAILEMYEDDYNPSSKVPGPRNMYNQGQLVQPNADGSRPGYSGDAIKLPDSPDAGTKAVGGGVYEVTSKKGFKTYYAKVRGEKKSFGKDKEAAENFVKEELAKPDTRKLKKSVIDIQSESGTLLEQPKYKTNLTKALDEVTALQEKGYGNIDEIVKKYQKIFTQKVGSKTKTGKTVKTGVGSTEYKAVTFAINEHAKKLGIQSIKNNNAIKALNAYTKLKSPQRGDLTRIAKKYNVPSGTFERLLTNLDIRKKIPLQFGSEAEKKKYYAKLRNDAINEFSSQKFEKFLSAPETSLVQKSHLGDLYNQYVRTGNLGYAPNLINQETLKDVDAILKEYNEQINDLFKNKPKGYRNKIDLLNQKGNNLAAATQGYKKFTGRDPFTGKEFTINFSKPSQELDPTDLYGNKKLSEMTKADKITAVYDPKTEKYKKVNIPLLEDMKKQSMKSAKLSKKETNKMSKLILSELEKLGCGKSAGGRIMFGEGTSCAIKGREVLEKGLKNGFKESDQALARGILKAGRGMGNIFALRNLLGPAAMGFTVAAEAGLVGYDMLSSGKSFREAVGDSLFNYALGDKTKIDSDEERYKRYASLGYDVDKIRNYENTMDRINEIGFQYDDLYGKANAVNIGGPRRSDAIKQKQQIISDKALAEIPAFSQDLYRTGEVPRLEDFVKNNFVSGAEEIQRADQEALIQQLESGGPKFMGMVFPRFEEGRQQDILNAQGILGYKSPSSTVSNYMSNLSEGGIASLNVKK